jgi:hypothetical protein
MCLSIYKTMKNAIFFLLFTLLLLSETYSQQDGFVRTYGSENMNYGVKVHVLQDTSYLLLGNKSGFVNMNNVYLLHVDKIGNIIWDNVYGGTSLFYANDMCSIGDSLFAITGMALTDSSDDYDAFLLVIDKVGEIQTSVIFHEEGWGFGKSIVADESGQILIAAQSMNLQTLPLLHVKKLLLDGTVLREVVWQMNAEVMPSAMCIYNSNELCIAGNIIYTDQDSQGFILHLSNELEIIDTLFFGSEGYDYEIHDIAETDSNHIVASGRAVAQESNQYHALKIMLNEYKEVIVESVNDRDRESLNSIAIAPFDTRIAYCGSTYFLGGGDMNVLYQIDNYIHYVTIRHFGGALDEEALHCAFALDSSLVVIGNTQSWGPNPISILFFKTDKLFSHNMNDFMHITSVTYNKAKHEMNCYLYPNPVGDMLFVSTGIDLQLEITIVNIFGKIIDTKKVYENSGGFEINVNSYQSGIYFLHVKSHEGVCVNKFIKL